MSSSALRPPRQPKEVTLPARRLAAVVGVVALPLGLAACGMFGNDPQDKAPVVIPSETAVNNNSPSGDTASTSSKAPAAPVPSTVTKTGVVTRHETRVLRTTATKTLPKATVTQPPITLTQTETQTETRTETQTIISVLPAQTKTVNKTLTRTRTVTRTITRKG